MSSSGISPFATKVLLQPKRLVSRLCLILHPERGYLTIGEHPTPRSLHRPLAPPPESEAESPFAPDSDNLPLSHRYAQMARELLSSLPSPCCFLSPEDFKLVGEHPIAAGRFANVWEGAYEGRKVVLKSYRCYELFDVAQVAARFWNEVHTCNLLRQGGVDMVPFVGVYSTEAHPLGVVYEYAEDLDLRQRLRNGPNVGGLKLLTEIARCLKHIHGLNIAHGQLEPTNILVDKDGTAHIAGFGSASISPRSTGWTMEGGINSGRVLHNNASELIPPGEPEGGPDSSLPTKASDIYNFGIVAWEVLTGRPPFFEMAEIAATYSMRNGARPPRPNLHEISDRVWYMVERCWHNVPSKRMLVGEVVDLLEAELRRGSSPGSSPSAQQ